MMLCECDNILAGAFPGSMKKTYVFMTLVETVTNRT